MDKFHSSSWDERSNLIEGFEDSRYRELAERLVCSNSLKKVSDGSRKKYQTFIEQRLLDKGPWLNLTTAQEKTKSLLDKAIFEKNEEDKNILQVLQKKLSVMAK